jgi:hypothetical protein
LIIKDIEENPNKYVLVSFDGIVDAVFPLGLKGRDTIDLSDPDDQVQLNRLYAKLEDKSIYDFAQVSSTRPAITTHPVQPFNTGTAKPVLSISKFEAKIGGSWQQASLYRRAEFDLILELKNDGNVTIPEFNVQLIGPGQLGETLHQYSEAENALLYEEHVTQKVFPGQTVKIKPIKVQVTNNSVRSIINAPLTINIYHENGQITKSYPCKEIFIFQSPYHGPVPMSLDLFALHS